MAVAVLSEAVIVPMRESDLDAVFAAEQHIYPFPWTRGNFADSLLAGYSAWVCADVRQLNGYAVAMKVVDELHILNLSVLPEHRRRGLGSALLCHLMSSARLHDAARLLLEVRPSNDAGLALYQRFGFSAIGRRKDYYPAVGGREDAVVMCLDL